MWTANLEHRRFLSVFITVHCSDLIIIDFSVWLKRTAESGIITKLIKMTATKNEI